MTPIWRALSNEAGLAAEHLASGISTLGKANYAQKGIYFQAFFDLTTGFERTAKLEIIIDYYLSNGGNFPTNETLRSYGHDLKELLERVDKIAELRNYGKEHGRLPRTSIHESIINILSEFAKTSRYYNLNYLTNESKVTQLDDPLKAWYENVIIPILKLHYRKRQKEKDALKANSIDAMLGKHSCVLFSSEDGRNIESISEASKQTSQTEFAKPYCRMYIMQIMRFLASLISDLSDDAVKVSMEKGREDIPFLKEFFYIFGNEDSYFKRRKTWSIYSL